MKRTHAIAAAMIAMAAVASQPAAAYDITTTGHTRATPQLAVDILSTISRYSKATDGCAFVFSADMQVLPRDYSPTRTTVPVTSRGGHYEQWTLNACAAKQRFLVAMWPSPRGGSDYAVTPLTGRMSLAQ